MPVMTVMVVGMISVVTSVMIVAIVMLTLSLNVIWRSLSPTLSLTA
jgi:hypothetical protein